MTTTRLPNAGLLLLVFTATLGALFLVADRAVIARNAVNIAFVDILIGNGDKAPLADAARAYAPAMDDVTEARLALTLLTRADGVKPDANVPTLPSSALSLVQQMAAPVRDRIAAALLDLYRQAQAAGRAVDAEEALRATLSLRPADLYAQQQLAEMTGTVFTFHERPPLDSLTSDVSAVRAGIVEVARTAMASGAWSTDFVARLGRLWVWTYGGAAAVESLLELGAEKEPYAARWPTLLGEMYARTGAALDAESAYRAALAIDVHAADPQRGLAYILLARSQSGDQDARAAARLEALALVQGLLAQDALDMEARRMEGELMAQKGMPSGAHSTARTEKYIATWLNVDLDEIHYGNELVLNGAFVKWLGARDPLPWTWSDMSGPPYFGEGLYTGGPDMFETPNGSSARVDGIWREGDRAVQGARAGYWYGLLTLPAGALQQIGVTYRTAPDCPPESASLLLEPSNPRLYPESFLPSTRGAWHRELLLLHNATPQDITLRPLVRNWAACTLWVGVVSVLPIQWPQGTAASDVPPVSASWELKPIAEVLQ